MTVRNSAAPPLAPPWSGANDASTGAPRLPRPGDVVAGKYRIEKVVGEGGMGIVYAAHHLVLDQRVALKLLLLDSLAGNETVERFVREAQAAARLRSEHVVRVTDAGALESGIPFLVMEFLQGCDLAELLTLDGPLPPSDTADCVLQALSALAVAHRAGIVHRDLKPANLFLALREDGSNVLKILDFGISKQSSTKAQWKELTGKAVLGTPGYMSPEQLRSSKSVDARADIWSLGVVMYELLTGRLPFDGDGPGEVFAAILEQTPAPPRTLRPDLAPAWDAIVMRCLSRDPAARFQDVAELARALAPLASSRWRHLPAAVGDAVAGPVRSLTMDGKALVEAAVAAAITSLPPPRMREPSGRRDDASATFVTGKTMVADIAPVRRAVSRPRSAIAIVGAVALAVVATFFGARHPSVAAAAPRVARVAVESMVLVADRAPRVEEDPVAFSAPSSTVPVAVASKARRRATSPSKTVASGRPSVLKSWR